MNHATPFVRPVLRPLASLTLLLPLTACGAAPLSSIAEPRAAPAMESAPAPGLPPTTASTAPSPLAASKSAPPAPGAGAAIPAASVRAPLVTYTGEMNLRVEKDASGAIDAIIGAAESVGGYLAARRDAAVEVRVPSPRFRDAIAKIEPLGEVTHRSVAATDVSDEFHDAEVRLENLRATRDRLQALLAQKGTLADTLAVEHELERVAMEIDRLEGRLEYLKSRVAYSSIAVTVEARRAPQAVITTLAPKRFVELPVKWLAELGVDRLLTLR
jgi:hypothetical protein